MTKTQKTYRFIVEIPGISARDIKTDLVYHLKSSRLAPKDAGPYYWDAHVKEYTRVVSKRDPDSMVALSIMVQNTVTTLQNAAKDLATVVSKKERRLFQDEDPVR